jgi:hypothetical protein
LSAAVPLAAMGAVRIEPAPGLIVGALSAGALGCALLSGDALAVHARAAATGRQQPRVSLVPGFAASRDAVQLRLSGSY